MKTLIILSSIILSSCTCTIMDDDYQYIQPELKSYVESFQKEAAARGISVNTATLKISFYSLEDGKAGRCEYAYDMIYIDSSKSDYKLYPEWLLFHELGHLYLHRDHDDRMITFPDIEGMEYPKSIMHHENKLVWDDKRKAYYLEELFGSELVIDEHGSVEPPSDPPQPDGLPESN